MRVYCLLLQFRVGVEWESGVDCVMCSDLCAILHMSRGVGQWGSGQTRDDDENDNGNKQE